MVREDKVDILVELTGHTANNRLGMMACRPAPIQVFQSSHVVFLIHFLHLQVAKRLLIVCCMCI